ncbi:MAG: DUF6784 domain-containing protein [Candidatus Latescibacterota bacterium]
MGWLLKLAVLRYGGPRLYRASRPFLIGLIAGQASVAGVWLVVDYLTGMTDIISLPPRQPAFRRARRAARARPRPASARSPLRACLPAGCRSRHPSRGRGPG